MRAPDFRELLARIEARGKTHGLARAAGYIERRETLDFHAATDITWLSGEWAGESLGECLGIDPSMLDADELSDACDVYENRADNAFWDALQDAGLLHDGV